MYAQSCLMLCDPKESLFICMICIFLMISGVEHLFMFLSAISMSFLGKCSEPLPILNPVVWVLFFFLMCILDIVYCPLWFVTRSCPTLVSPQWNSPGKNTKVGSYCFSRGSSQPRDQTHISCIAGGFFIPEPQGKPVYVQFVNQV